MSAPRYFDGDTFTREGVAFRFRSEADDMLRMPWKEDEGHGAVSEWTRRDKRPGEVIIASDHGSHLFYDLAEATSIALRDGWGIPNKGRDATAREVAAMAASLDCDRMRRYCDDLWHYLGIIVDRIDSDGAVIDTTSLWGIESDSGLEYFAEVAHELADELLGAYHAHEAKIDAVMAGL
jgi:hypothetical protein